jgi:hypothetical protein
LNALIAVHRERPIAGALPAKPVMLQKLKRFGVLFWAIFPREKKNPTLAQILERFVAIRIGAMTQHSERTPSMFSM